VGTRRHRHMRKRTTLARTADTKCHPSYQRNPSRSTGRLAGGPPWTGFRFGIDNIRHAVEFSRIGRTPGPALLGRSRGNPSNLAHRVSRVKPGKSRRALTSAGRPPSPASRSPRAVGNLRSLTRRRQIPTPHCLEQRRRSIHSTPAHTLPHRLSGSRRRIRPGQPPPHPDTSAPPRPVRTRRRIRPGQQPPHPDNTPPHRSVRTRLSGPTPPRRQSVFRVGGRPTGH
jgi:hypothetical protein